MIDLPTYLVEELGGCWRCGLFRWESALLWEGKRRSPIFRDIDVRHVTAQSRWAIRMRRSRPSRRATSIRGDIGEIKWTNVAIWIWNIERKWIDGHKWSRERLQILFVRNNGNGSSFSHWDRRGKKTIAEREMNTEKARKTVRSFKLWLLRSRLVSYCQPSLVNALVSTSFQSDRSKQSFLYSAWDVRRIDFSMDSCW